MHRHISRWVLIAAVTLTAPPVFAAAPTSVPNDPLIALQGVVSDMYSYSLKIVGLCVFVMFLIAGLGYILPASIRPKFMSDPWGIIKDAIIGLVLLFSAYLILNTINPDLVGNRSAPAARTQQ